MTKRSGRTGSHRFTDLETGETLYADIAVEVSDDKARAAIAAIDDPTNAGSISSGSRDVVWWEREIDRQIKARQYATRAIRSEFKFRTIAGVEVRPDGTMPCPECQDLGEANLECTVCPGTGVLSEGEFTTWLESRGYDSF